MYDNFNSNKVSIIILNWNGWKDTIECLESLYQIDYPNYEVIIVDNHSEDDSIEKIKEYCSGEIKVESEFFDYVPNNKPIMVFEYSKSEIEYPILVDEFKNLSCNRRIIILKNDLNYGFAEGNNIGIRFALKNLHFEYILLLNNDTVVDRDFLGEMVNLATKNPKIGVTGPKIYYYNYEGKINVTNFEGGKINFLKGEASHISNNKNIEKPQEVDYVEGSCFLIKKEVIGKVGLLDPEYFLYWEETDWCVRIKKEFYSLMYVPTAKIWHKITDEPKNTNIYYMARNKFLFMKKNSKNLQMLFFLMYFFFFKFWFKIFVYIFYYRNLKMVNYFIEGIKDGLKILIS